MKYSEFKQQVSAELQAAGERFTQLPWTEPTFYANYLAQTFHYVCHSTRLLALAGARFRVNRDELHHRFLQHAGEEKKHEVVAVQDLQKLGHRLEEFPESSETQALYQTQYYWIEHESPLCFFGYILALEGIAVLGAGPAFETLKKGGFEKSAQFLKLHSGEDPDHLDKAFEAIEKFVTSEDDLGKIYQNFRLSLGLYFGMTRACQETRAESTRTPGFKGVRRAA